MNNKIDNLSKGEFFSAKTNIYSDAYDLGCNLFSNRKYEDSVTIYNDRDQIMHGDVYSTNDRISITSSLIDKKNYKLTFVIDTINLNENDVIEGKLIIVTDIGELTLNYKYDINDDDDTKILKNLRSIENYYDLVKDDVDKAINLFISNKIYKTDLVKNEEFLAYYETLKKGSNRYIAIYELFKSFDYDIKEYLQKYEDGSFNNYLKNKSKVLDDTFETNYQPKEDNNKIISIIDKINDKDLIDSIAISYVRKGRHDEIAFNIFTKALSFGSTINNLYNAILESLPKNFDKKLPLYVYRYFYEDRSYSFEQKIALYENIIYAFDEIDDIYKLFYDEIKQFALSEIYQNKISESLVKLYKTVIKKDVVNKDNASNILYLVRNYKLNVKNSNIKYVIIKYKETNNETKYEINNGICFLPVFFDSYILFFEDVSGNILLDVKYDLKVLFDNKEIENYCLQISQDKNLFYFSKFIDLKEKNVIDGVDFDIYNKINNFLNLNKASIYQMDLKIIDYLISKDSNDVLQENEEMKYVENIEFDKFDDFYKKKLLKIMLKYKNYSYVYKNILKYNIDFLEDDDKIEFFENSIKTEQSFIDKVFLYMVLNFVKNNHKTIVLIDFLNQNLNSNIDNIYEVLNITKKQSLNTQVLAKKLLLMIFNQNDTKYLDDTFMYYDYKLDNDYNILLSYLTYKSYGYFCYNNEINENYIKLLMEYLINDIDNLTEIPLIYILSFTKYASTLNVLTNNDMRRILVKSVEYLLSKDLIFSYFKKLNKHIRLADSIMNKEYIEYHTDYDFIPRAKIRINNNPTEIDIELVNVYKNIYVKSLYVYKNEVINYKIYNSQSAENGILGEGSLSYNNDNLYVNNTKSTYDYVNDIILNFDNNDFNKTKDSIVAFEIRKEEVKNLFNI